MVCKYWWKGDNQLTCVHKDNGYVLFAMSHRQHGERLIELTIELVKLLNAGTERE